jgi:hypothetical protein
MADIATIAEIGTAVGTLFLGAATFHWVLDGDDPRELDGE